MTGPREKGAVGGDRTEVVLAGMGGQGLVYIGRLLGQAAIDAGQHAVQTQSYGVATRGGFTKSEVLIASRPLAYPMATDPDAVLALTAEAYDRYSGSLKPGAVLVYDSDAVPQGRAGEFAFPFTTEARRRDLSGSYNLLALGAFVAASGVLPRETVMGLVRGANLEAYEIGIALAEQKGSDRQ